MTRVAIWCLIVFVVLPRRIFRAAPGQPFARKLLDGAVRMAVATIVVVWVLVLLGTFEVFSLLVSYAAIGVTRAAMQLRLSPVALARRTWQQTVIWAPGVLDAGHQIKVRAKTWQSVARAAIRRRRRGGLESVIDPSWAPTLVAVAALAVILLPRITELLHEPLASDLEPIPSKPSEAPAQRIVGAAALLIAAMAMPARFGLPEFIRPADVARMLVPVGPSPWRWARRKGFGSPGHIPSGGRRSPADPCWPSGVSSRPRQRS
jgi:hypothetical protein